MPRPGDVPEAGDIAVGVNAALAGNRFDVPWELRKVEELDVVAVGGTVERRCRATRTCSQYRYSHCLPRCFELTLSDVNSFSQDALIVELLGRFRVDW